MSRRNAAQERGLGGTPELPGLPYRVVAVLAFSLGLALGAVAGWIGAFAYAFRP